MISLSKYKDNQTTEPVKTKTSPFRSLDRTCNLFEEVFRREDHKEEKLIFENLWSKNGE